MKVKKKKPNPKGTKVTKEFVFKLTHAESEEKGRAMAALDKEVADLELQFEDVKQTWKAKINTRESKRKEISAIVNAQEEKRTVEAVMVKDYDAKEIQYYFDGAILESRTMTESELQVNMDLDKVAKKAKAVRQKIEKPDPVAAAHTNGVLSDLAEVHKLETSRHGKTSAVDGPTGA